MDSNSLWHQTLQSYRAEGVQLVSLEEADAETALHAIAAGDLSLAIAAFLHLWQHGSSDLWQVLIQSAATLHADVTEELTVTVLLEPWRCLSPTYNSDYDMGHLSSPLVLRLWLPHH